MKRVLTIIVTYNGLSWIDSCLGSLRRSEYPTDVYLVDNSSTDGTPEYVREHYPEVILHESSENLGFGKANNQGLKYALTNGYDYAYLLNQDAWVQPETLGHLVDAMESNQEYGVLSPVQMNASMQHPDAAFEEKCLKGPLSGYESGTVYQVPFVMAAHWMISRRALEEVGGFSPVFYHYGEDDNYLDRVKFKGMKVGFLAGTYAVHDRESRVLTKSFRMRRKYIMALSRISNPSNCLAFRLVYQPIEMLLWSLRWLSVDLLKYIPRLLGAYPELIRNRRESIKKGAFL